MSIEASTPDPLHFRHTIGWLAWVTVPSAIAGLIVLVVAVAIFVSDRGVPLESIVALGSLGLFTAVVFGCASGLTLDKRIDLATQTVSDATLLFGWGRRRTLPLDGFDCVHILPGTIQGAHQTHRRWKVFLVGTSDQRSVTVYLSEFSERRLAEELAAEISRATRLPITTTAPH